MNKILCLIGGSGAGKTTLAKFLQDSGNYAETVSTTTRAPREGERNGSDYYFTSRDEFLSLKKDGRFVETFEFNNCFYGTSILELQRIFESGKTPVLVLEPNGAHNIAKWCANNNDFQVGCTLAFLKCDYGLTYDRFLDRAKKETEALKDDEKESGHDKVEAIINAVSSRLLLSLQEESSWDKALDYDIFVGPMIDGQSLEDAKIAIEESLAKEEIKGLGDIRIKQSLVSEDITSIKKSIRKDLLASGCITTKREWSFSP